MDSQRLAEIVGRSNTDDAVEGDLDSDIRLLRGLRRRLRLHADMDIDLYVAPCRQRRHPRVPRRYHTRLWVLISSKSTNDSRRQTFLVRPHRDFNSHTAFR